MVAKWPKKRLAADDVLGMYLRTTRRRNKDGSVVEYFHLAENVWDSERKCAMPRVVHNFGRAEDVDRAALVRLCDSIRRIALGETAETPRGLAAVEVLGSRPVGGAHAARALWEELGIGELLRGLEPRRRGKAPHERALFAMVLHRLLDPGSKRACRLRWLRRAVYLPEAEELSLEQLYRALDFLHEHEEAIERGVFERAAERTGALVDLVFFDTTSVYFHVDEEDELRRRGHSKDDRDGRPQVVVALAVTRDGLPVRSWVLPGNTADVKVVARIKADLASWKLGRVLLIGDAGMDSAENREVLARGLGHFVLAMPVGRLSEVQEVVSRAGRFQKLDGGLEVREVMAGEGELRRRYVVLRNPEESRRQKAHRQALLEQLAGELGSLGEQGREHHRRVCHLLASPRYGRYLSRAEDGTIDIDVEKVRRIGRLDGRTVLHTNDDTLCAEDVARAYKAMMVIESCFRRMKTTGLRIRPVYHWTEHRITSHVKLCVLALLVQRVCEIRAKRTWPQIANELQRIAAIDCLVEGKVVVRTTKLSPAAVSLLDALRVPKPRAVLAVSQPQARA